MTTSSFNRLTNRVNPLNRLTNRANPLNRLTNRVNLLNRLTNRVHPLNRLTNRVHPLHRLTNRVNPLNRLTDRVNPLIDRRLLRGFVSSPARTEFSRFSNNTLSSKRISKVSSKNGPFISVVTFTADKNNFQVFCVDMPYSLFPCLF